MFEIENTVSCPHCEEDNFICTIVPDSAWYPGGASFAVNHNCYECGEWFEISGRVESSLELS